MTFVVQSLILSLDVTIDVSIWSTVEPGIGITAASIATLRPLLQTLLWRLGFAPAPSYITTRPGYSRDGRSDNQYRLDWFPRTNRTPDLAHIESSTSTTISATFSNQKGETSVTSRA
jgi:hypothetical protein